MIKQGLDYDNNVGFRRRMGCCHCLCLWWHCCQMSARKFHWLVSAWLPTHLLYGDYVRQWVPELQGIKGADVHTPWTLSTAALSHAHVSLGETYPTPIVIAPEWSRHVNKKPVGVGEKGSGWLWWFFLSHGCKQKWYNFWDAWFKHFYFIYFILLLHYIYHTLKKVLVTFQFIILPKRTDDRPINSAYHLGYLSC